MTGWLNRFSEFTLAQCWGCGVFDRLFQIVSKAGAALYNSMAEFGMVILAIFIALYVLYAVWKNLKKGGEDFTYQKSVKPVLINSLIVVTLLSTGVFFPRFITTVTMEPVASMTLLYSQAMLNKTAEEVETRISYSPESMNDDGFYRPQLRDKIILLIKTVTTQFQAMITLGLYVMDSAFSWQAITGIGTLIKHIIMFIMGLTLTWGFLKLFVKFCFYFIDVIVALSFFAFFFPLGLVFFVFRNSDPPGWVKSLGQKIAPKMLKDAMGSIITLGTVVITYVVILVLISRFIAGTETAGTELVNQILNNEDIFSNSLTEDDAVTMTLAGSIVLMYIVQFLASQVNEIAKSIVESFGIQDMAKTDLKGTDGESLGDMTLSSGEKLLKGGKRVASNLFSKEKTT
ncbi:MAG: hypothetical protein FWG80_04550 [Alphaproteobacteria bacterium]|nr:hypothetical protein [Alphaproteobacteria bacterium]